MPIPPFRRGPPRSDQRGRQLLLITPRVPIPNYCKCRANAERTVALASRGPVQLIQAGTGPFIDRLTTNTGSHVDNSPGAVDNHCGLGTTGANQ